MNNTWKLLWVVRNHSSPVCKPRTHIIPWDWYSFNIMIRSSVLSKHLIRPCHISHWATESIPYAIRLREGNCIWQKDILWIHGPRTSHPKTWNDVKVWQSECSVQCFSIASDAGIVCTDWMLTVKLHSWYKIRHSLHTTCESMTRPHHASEMWKTKTGCDYKNIKTKFITWKQGGLTLKNSLWIKIIVLIKR